MLDTKFAILSPFKLLLLALTFTVCAIFLVLSEFLPDMLILFKFTRVGYNIFSFLNLWFSFELSYNKYITCFILKLERPTTRVLDIESHRNQWKFMESPRKIRLFQQHGVGYTRSEINGVAYTERDTYGVEYIRNGIYTEWNTHGLGQTQSGIHMEWNTHGVGYTERNTHGVDYTRSGIHRVR